MDFYPSKNNDQLNRQPFAPDVATGRAMVNPHYRALIHPGTLALGDSGAYQDDGTTPKRRRLQARQALTTRQLEYETWLRWRIADGDPDWHLHGLVTYDRLLRGVAADVAVAETITNAIYYASQRHRIQGAILFSAQGATTAQYLACIDALLECMQPGDWLAFGGFAGTVRYRMKTFCEVLVAALPLLDAKGITHAHILGVTSADAIREAARLGRINKIHMSTDSSSAEINGVMGRAWCNEREVWAPTYTKEQKYIDYHPAQLALDNIAAYSRWSASL